MTTSDKFQLIRDTGGRGSLRSDFCLEDLNIWLPAIPGPAEIITQNACRIYNPFLIHGCSPWQILQEICLNHPGTTVAVRPYDSRATLFLGMPDTPYVNSSSVLRTYNLQERMRNGALKGEIKTDGANLQPFRKYHLCRSGENLIRNNLKMTKYIYTCVTLGWDRNVDVRVFATLCSNAGHALADIGKQTKSEANDWSNSVRSTYVNSNMPLEHNPDGITGAVSDTQVSRHSTGAIGVKPVLIFDAMMPKDQIRNLYVEKRNVTDEDMALRYQVSILADCLRRAYYGELWIRGDADIWPNDVIMLYDEANRMYGAVEVAESILHFDRENGYYYVVKPDVLVAPQDMLTPNQLRLHKCILIPRDFDPEKEYDQPSVGQAAGNVVGGIVSEPVKVTLGTLWTANPMNLEWFNSAWHKADHLCHGLLGKVSDRDRTVNHPVSVFPLFYQGRTWWPYASHGSTASIKLIGNVNDTLDERLEEARKPFKEGFWGSLKTIVNQWRYGNADISLQGTEEREGRQ